MHTKKKRESAQASFKPRSWFSLTPLILVLGSAACGLTESPDAVGRLAGMVEWIDIEGNINPVQIDDCRQTTWDTEDVPNQGWSLFGSFLQYNDAGNPPSVKTTISFCDEVAVIANFDPANTNRMVRNASRPRRTKVVVKNLVEGRLDKRCTGAKVALGEISFLGGGGLEFPFYDLPWSYSLKGNYDSSSYAEFNPPLEGERIICGRIDVTLSAKES